MKFIYEPKDRDALIKLKQNSPDTYNFLMSISDSETDYCKTLDIEKLKKECELGYFAVDDLFTKEQIFKSAEYLKDLCDKINDGPISINEYLEATNNLEKFKVENYKSGQFLLGNVYLAGEEIKKGELVSIQVNGIVIAKSAKEYQSSRLTWQMVKDAENEIKETLSITRGKRNGEHLFNEELFLKEMQTFNKPDTLSVTSDAFKRNERVIKGYWPTEMVNEVDFTSLSHFNFYKGDQYTCISNKSYFFIDDVKAGQIIEFLTNGTIRLAKEKTNTSSIASKYSRLLSND